MALQHLPDSFHDEAWAVIRRDMMAAAKRYVLAAYALGVDQAELDLGMVDLYDPAAQEFAAQFEYASIKSLTARQALETRDIIAQGVREGLGVSDIRRLLDAAFEGHVGTVDVIARTESNRAANWGRLHGYKQSGIVRQKEWVATLDDRVSPDHLEAHGEVVGINDAFTRGAAAGYQAPPLRPNCRCTIAPVTRLTSPEDIAADEEAGQAQADALGFNRRANHALIRGLVTLEGDHASALTAIWRNGAAHIEAHLDEANRFS